MVRVRGGKGGSEEEEESREGREVEISDLSHAVIGSVEQSGASSQGSHPRTCTSDPYVKFKIAGKEVFRSKTIHKNLNPVWNEETTLLIENIAEPLYVKVGNMQRFIILNSAVESLSTSRLPSLPCSASNLIPMKLILVSREIDLKNTVSLSIDSLKVALQNRGFPGCRAYKKDQLWKGIVGITLVKGQNLKSMDPNGLSDPYVKFKLGCQKYKSKTVLKSLNPEWREHFDFLLGDEKEEIVEITVWDKDSRKKDDFIGRCQINLSGLSREHTHKLELNLSEGNGRLVLLLTLTASPPVDIADTSVSKLEEEQQHKAIRRRYSLSKSFFNLRDIGFASVKIIRAEGLMVADVIGSSDPFCVIELNNDRLQTHTIHRSLNPIWNKVFTFNIKDIHSALELTVYDEDRDRTADFLGKVAIPLLSIQNGEERAYVLKNKNLTGPTKGVIYLEMEVIFNVIKASIRTITPKEEKYIEEEQRISKELLQKHYYRVKRCLLVIINTGRFLNSCFDWESPQRSLTAFLIFLVLVWNFELYMIPLIILLLMVYNYALLAMGKDNRTISMNLMEYEEDDGVKVDKETERKGLIDKLYAIQDICVTVQNGLDEAASLYERVKNTFNWTVPFLSWLAVFVLTVGTLLIYFVPLRYVILIWGIHKFTKKLRNPYLIDNNELLDFLSRVHSDVQVVCSISIYLDYCFLSLTRIPNSALAVSCLRAAQYYCNMLYQSDAMWI
uniref:Multiple C2 and transmembrane domain containing 1 n=1 Tax=Callorhinchus milii TaxID=7868 RepID=A0A4W3JS59_CALMI